MKVFKFGGGSVKDAGGVKQLKRILEMFSRENMVVVISAIGKTTNLLEKIVDTYYQESGNIALLVQELKHNHENIARELLGENNTVIASLAPLFAQLEGALAVPPSENYDYDYDKIVSFGELLSTTLISNYLNIEGIANTWEDARLLVRTDRTYREGKVDWEISTASIQNRMVEIFDGKKGHVVITQGFIGGTPELLPTTLGREGSDYSAAIFAYALDASEVIVWKDVPGFFSADPKTFPDAIKLDQIAYEEAIELSYYGATIIHPKTLKPLQNKNIKLHLKSFFKPEEQGTAISDVQQEEMIPSFIFKKNQILISIFPKDFSFIAIDNLSEIFAILSKNRVKINLMQNSALSFSICVDNVPRKIEPVLKELEILYKVKYNDKTELITIRHYTDDSLTKIIQGKKVLIEQKNRTTIQLVLA